MHREGQGPRRLSTSRNWRREKRGGESNRRRSVASLTPYRWAKPTLLYHPFILRTVPWFVKKGNNSTSNGNVFKHDHYHGLFILFLYFSLPCVLILHARSEPRSASDGLFAVCVSVAGHHWRLLGQRNPAKHSGHCGSADRSRDRDGALTRLFRSPEGQKRRRFGWFLDPLQFKVLPTRSGIPRCALRCFSEVSPGLPSKQFQCRSDWRVIFHFHERKKKFRLIYSLCIGTASRLCV